MARVNVGVDPKFLSDQHLIAESVEITMITGALRKDNYIIKGSVPEKFCLGKGHINFFKPKPNYLKTRLEAVNNEMKVRGFNPTTHIDISEFSQLALREKDWKPTTQDSLVVKERIMDRIKNPLKAKKNFHKYYGKPIEDIERFCQDLLNSDLYG